MIYLILLLAFILRLPLLNGSFWLDEAAQYLESARPLTEQLQIRDDFQPPLMHLLTFIAIRLGSLFNYQSTEWFLRLAVSLIPGVITIWAIYQIALKLFDRKVALLTSLFLATSSFHIFYSQELRPYSLPAMWATLATWQLITFLKNGKLKAKILFVIFSVLGLYSSYLYPFLLIGQFVYLLFSKRKNFQKILFLAAAIILPFLPWLPKFLEQLQAGQELRLSMPGWDKVVSLPQLKTAALVPAKFIFGVSDLQLNYLYVFLTLALVSPFIYFLYLAFKNTEYRKKLNFFLLLLFLPLILSWLISFFVPVLQAKRVLYLLPYFSLLEAFLIITYSKKHQHLAKIFLATTLAINLGSTIAYWQQPKLQRENWRALEQEISSKFPKDSTIVVFSFNQEFAPWQLYDQNQYKTLSTGTFYLDNLENPAEKFKVLSDYHYVLVFDYLRDLTDPNNLLLKIVQDLGFEPIGVLDYPNIGFVRIYSVNKLALDVNKL